MIRSEMCSDCKTEKATVFYEVGERCEDCSLEFNEKRFQEQLAEHAAERAAKLVHVCGEDDESCEVCCEHDDMEDFTCLSCGADRTEDAMCRAYDRAKDFRKYGE